MRTARNSVKKAVLNVLATRGPQRIDELALLARGTSRSWRNLYFLVARYEKFGLVARYRERDGKLGVEITERGRERLRWLQQ